MKVRFLQNAIIKDCLYAEEGQIFEAIEDGDFIVINFSEDFDVKAPKSEIDGVLEVLR